AASMKTICLPFCLPIFSRRIMWGIQKATASGDAEAVKRFRWRTTTEDRRLRKGGSASHVGSGDQFQLQCLAYGLCGPLQRFQGDGAVLGVEHPVELGAAGVHQLCHGGLAELALRHLLAELPRNDALHRCGGGGLQRALFAEEIFERSAEMGI